MYLFVECPIAAQSKKHKLHVILFFLLSSKFWIDFTAILYFEVKISAKYFLIWDFNEIYLINCLGHWMIMYWSHMGPPFHTIRNDLIVVCVSFCRAPSCWSLQPWEGKGTGIHTIWLLLWQCAGKLYISWLKCY